MRRQEVPPACAVDEHPEALVGSVESGVADRHGDRHRRDAGDLRAVAATQRIHPDPGTWDPYTSPLRHQDQRLVQGGTLHAEQGQDGLTGEPGARTRAEDRSESELRGGNRHARHCVHAPQHTDQRAVGDPSRDRAPGDPRREELRPSDQAVLTTQVSEH